MTFEGTYSTSIPGVNPDELHDRVSRALGTWGGHDYGWPRLEYWTWQQAYHTVDWAPDDQPHAWFATSSYLKAGSLLNQSGLDLIRSSFTKVPKGCTANINFDAWGGAIANWTASSTAFPHRDALYSMQAIGRVRAAAGGEGEGEEEGELKKEACSG